LTIILIKKPVAIKRLAFFINNSTFANGEVKEFKEVREVLAMQAAEPSESHMLYS
jgi:hypothetical protein